jgi:hypothetical protein
MVLKTKWNQYIVHVQKVKNTKVIHVRKIKSISHFGYAEIALQGE